jgi:hypothetical protein
VYPCPQANGVVQHWQRIKDEFADLESARDIPMFSGDQVR